MELFSDQPLGQRPHIAVVGSNKLGNFVVTTPLLRGLKAKYPDCILDFFGSDLTHEFEENLSTIDWRVSLHTRSTDRAEPLKALIDQRRQHYGAYDLAINCDEYSDQTHWAMAAMQPTYVVGGATSSVFNQALDFGNHPVQCMLQDANWNGPEFVEKYRDITQSNYIAELLCRLAYVETDFTHLELPSQPPRFAVPDVLVHVTASRAAKLWRPDYWQQVIDGCQRQGLSVGLVGSRPEVQQQFYPADGVEEQLLLNPGLIDLRGQATLPELAGALAQAKVFITVDTGPLHIAAAVGCPTVAIFGNDRDGDGASPVRLWAPRQPWVKLALSDAKCTLCQEQRFKNASCLQEQQRCMVALPPERVMGLVGVGLEMGVGV